jgi:hypothetical protein
MDKDGCEPVVPLTRLAGQTPKLGDKEANLTDVG